MATEVTLSFLCLPPHPHYSIFIFSYFIFPPTHNPYQVVIGLAISISVFNIPKAFETTAIPDPTNMTQCLVTTETPLLEDDIYFWFYKYVCNEQEGSQIIMVYNGLYLHNI